jgi:hypothetical protein
MSAYWQGLTGKAAEWAIYKQKSHWWVREKAMKLIEALVDEGEEAMMLIKALVNENWPPKGVSWYNRLRLKNIQTQNAWEMFKKGVFGHILPLWSQFWGSFALKISGSATSKFVALWCPALYNTRQTTWMHSYQNI